MQTGVTVWFTGLSGAGKSTISECVQKALQARHCSVELLDGDAVRKELCADLGFSEEDRRMNIERVAYASKLLTRHDVIVLAAFISPYRQMRRYCREQIGSFIEVYVRCPLHECIRRDVKGLYQKAMNGEIEQFTGISDPYEEPEHPDLVLDAYEQTTQECTRQVVRLLEEQHYI